MMCRIRHILSLAVMGLGLVPLLMAQRPCNDTLCRVFDSVCEGMQYDFNGRILTRSGFYYDTLKRAGGVCDSVIILRLEVLEYPFSIPGSQVRCDNPFGYHVAVPDGGGSMFVRWSSMPEDSTLAGQERQSAVFVSPAVPTVYEVHVDYREAEQCPSTGRIELRPVEPVVAQMLVSPDCLSYDNMEIFVKDFSIGTRGYHHSGQSGRNWFLNGIRQGDQSNQTAFPVKPWMEGDSVVVKMVAYTPTCVDSVSKVVPFRRVGLYFPNVFFPGQEANGHFSPVVHGVTEYELWVYDRRGGLVFHSDAHVPWDGTHNGSPCPAATYVYKCRYRDIETPAGFQNLAGTVTLVR